MNCEKISPPLSEFLKETSGEDWLDLVVELTEPAEADVATSSGGAKIAARKEQFARQAKPVSDQIRRMGGEVTGEAWINGSLRVRLAKKMIPVLSKERLVARLDLPHKIHPEISSK